MQVMPATGKDMQVGGITQTGNNIHAGVKYMRLTIGSIRPVSARFPLSRLT
jgi:hypothetical protein